MLALYRGNPENEGVIVGYFDDITEVQCAIYEDSRNHEGGNSYYIIQDREMNENEYGFSIKGDQGALP